MLGDDIMNGTKRLAATVAHAAGNVVRGAILFAAVVGVVYGLGVLGAAIGTVGLAGLPELAATAATGATAATSHVMATAATNLAAGLFNAGGYALTAGIVGGLVTGAASLLPGRSEGFTLRRGFNKIESMGKKHGRDQNIEQTAPTAAPSYSAPQQSTTTREVIYQQAAPSTHTREVIYQAPQTTREVIYQQVPVPQQQSPAPSTIVDNSQTHVYSSREAPRTVVMNAEQQPAPAPQQLETPQAQANLASDNPYFRQGKGMELMQRGNERSNESVVAK